MNSKIQISPAVRRRANLSLHEGADLCTTPTASGKAVRGISRRMPFSIALPGRAAADGAPHIADEISQSAGRRTSKPLLFRASGTSSLDGLECRESACACNRHHRYCDRSLSSARCVPHLSQRPPQWICECEAHLISNKFVLAEHQQMAAWIHVKFPMKGGCWRKWRSTLKLQMQKAVEMVQFLHGVRGAHNRSPGKRHQALAGMSAFTPLRIPADYPHAAPSPPFSSGGPGEAVECH